MYRLFIKGALMAALVMPSPAAAQAASSDLSAYILTPEPAPAPRINGARDIDDKMGDARRALDWEAQWKCAIDPETAKAIRDDRSPEHDDTCSMCGKFCAVRSMNKALAGEHIDIL